ncbi:GRIP and coiled-coil domain-containing protein 2-like [Anthonomus grandis grandis]|uniref:GRIP and coiled-coil domain-containing protein 2-like n=1 Tax=Anthonomus grandis grandis TaxID=2921223 RepID=UPI0021653C24|nr:GRIP and coiled-coil domain-containing protein 2-like [Anthonomus grandis grandis]
MEASEPKKINLEDLAREELIKKCKNLITLAQKAKSSKETLKEEITGLREKLRQHEISDVTKELIERLTDEKLALVTQNEDLKAKIKQLNERYSTLETENISYSRQVKRLTDENETLLSDITTFEEQIAELKSIGIEQRNQLLELEKSGGNHMKELQNKLSFSLEEVNQLNNSLKEKENEIRELSQELQALKIIRNSSSNNDCDIKYRNIESMNEKLKNKVTLYHSKLKKFAFTIKEIREEKNQVIDVFKKYTDQIKDWKEQLSIASSHLIKLVNGLEHENESLKKDRHVISAKIEELNKYIDDLTNKIKMKQELLDNAIKTNQNIESENIKLKESFDKIQNDLLAKQTQYKETIEDFEASQKDEVNKLNDALKGSTKEVSRLMELNAFLEEEIKKLNATLLRYQTDLSSLNEELQAKQKILEDTIENEIEKNEIAALNKIINSQQEHITDLTKSIETEKQFAEKSSEEILRLAQTNKDLEATNSELQQKLLSFVSKTFEDSLCQTDEEHMGEEIGINHKRENAELLSEMNQMNQALKERGEIISKLEAHCEEMKKKLQLFETQASKNIDSLTEKDETIKTLSEELNSLKNLNEENHIINGLRDEIEALKDKLNSTAETSYAESEAMSTSTISRSEEVNRLKDLEGPWEERYGKLRNLALKQKAKIKEQTITITEFEKEREQLSEALKVLQAQIDNLEDETEQLKQENMQYLSKLNSVAENISKDKMLLVQNEETISTLTKEIEKLKDEKKNVEAWKKQVGAKVQTLRKELEAKNVLIKDSEAKVTKLEQELCHEKEQLKHTKDLLDQTTNECKKNSVLNLEMQDYERSVHELSQKVEKQKTEHLNLQTQLESQRVTISALKEQNKLLEERLREESESVESNSVELTACKKNISHMEDVLQQKEAQLQDTMRLLEQVRSENEELSTDLTKIIAEHQKSLNTLKSERDQLRNQLVSLHQDLRDSQDTLKLKEDELRNIKEDYETYKVRAQSVLKKNQNRDLGLEEKLSEEVCTLKEQTCQLNEELKSIRDKLGQEEQKNKVLIKERDNLLTKCKDLETEVEELKSYNDQLAAKHQKELSEHIEAVRNLKVHADTLSQCYRQQISELEVQHNREIIELQSKLEKAPSPVHCTFPVPPSMPREEGEGSESVESNPLPNNVHPIPLERLLDSKSEDEVMALKKQLYQQESKVNHLTALLSDTEQDLSKHVQMNKVLKEEIRRQQRSVEREKHAENLEYLKNVVFKFVTLHNGDEKSRLVPVLNTILKLSPEETQKLSTVARGDPGTKGWTSYLPTSWSSPNKPQ